MEPAGRIAQKDIRFARLCGSHSVIDHRRRIRAFLSADHVHTRAVRPLLQLFACGGAESIRSGDHHFLSLVFQFARKLSDGGCLAHSVHADHEYD